MSSPAREVPFPFVSPVSSSVTAVRAAHLATVEHPDWCDRTRCDVRVGAVRHIGHPVYWHGQADDVEFSLSKLQREDGAERLLFGSRHLAVIDTFEVEMLKTDIDAFLVARSRLELRDNDMEGDPREELDLIDAAEPERA